MSDSEEFMVECPCCGKLTMSPKKRVDEKLREQYLKCMITGVPFQQTYNLFQGKLKISCSELTVKQQTLAAKLSRKMADNEIQKEQATGALYSILRYVTVTSIKLDAYKEFKPQECIQEVVQKLLNKDSITDKDLEEAELKVVSQNTLGTVSSAVLDRVVTIHLKNLMYLSQEGFDKDFFSSVVSDY